MAIKEHLVSKRHQKV